MIKYVLAATAVLFSVSANAATFEVKNNVMTIEGDIESGDWTTFNEAFTDKVNHIKLDSDGGVVYVGEWIAEDIAARGGVYTEAVGTCTSMCGIIWLAGEYHVFNSEGEIGFHLSYYPDRVSAYGDAKENYGWYGVESMIKGQTLNSVALHIEYLDNKALAPWMIENLSENGRMGHQMWYPTKSELIDMEGAFVNAPIYIAPKPATTKYTNDAGFYTTGYAEVDGAQYGHLYINQTVVMHATADTWVAKVFNSGKPTKMAFHTGLYDRSSADKYTWYGFDHDVAKFYKNDSGKWIIFFDEDTRAWLLDQIDRNSSQIVTIGFASASGSWGSLTFNVIRQ